MLDVITADRVVAQISTVHPAYGTGQVPSASARASTIWRIGGHEVGVTPKIRHPGPRREDDTSYFEDDEVLGRIWRKTQYETRLPLRRICPEWAAMRLPEGPPRIFKRQRPAGMFRGQRRKRRSRNPVRPCDRPPALRHNLSGRIASGGTAIVRPQKRNQRCVHIPPHHDSSGVGMPG